MIELQFATESTLTSDFIRFWTWSRWSHVDILTPTNRLLGARLNGGVKARPLEYTNFSRLLRVKVKCTEEVGKAVIHIARDQLGKPYDLWAIAGFAFRRDWRTPDSWFCSELVAYCFEKAGMPLLNAAHLNRVTPRDLFLSPYLEPA